MEDCSTDERLQQETLCHRQWTDEYVERPEMLMRQNLVVMWMVDVVRHTDMLSVSVCASKQTNRHRRKDSQTCIT